MLEEDEVRCILDSLVSGNTNHLKMHVLLIHTAC
jgi:hypothetical protein